MAIGSVNLRLGVDQESLTKSLNKVQGKIKNAVTSMKNVFIAAKLGQYLFSGADKSIEEFKAKARTLANFQDLGFDKTISEQVFEISNNFEKLGYSAETANDAMLQFIASGKATALRQMGIYLDKNTQSTLSNATAQDRLNWLLSNSNNIYSNLKSAMPPHIQTMIEMRKSVEDLQKSLGQAFLATINNIVNAFGGLQNAMKIALVAFTAYKMAMIVGNVAIAISKTLAMGGLFAAPVAFGIGAASLAALLAMGIGAGIAYNAISNSQPAEQNNTPISPTVNDISVAVYTDQYGREVKSSSGGNLGAVKSTYGSSQ